MLYIFPDTNIFIHGKHFEEIDWVALSGSKEVTIILGPSVIAELDKHKYHSSKKVAGRARKLLPRIEEILKNPSESKLKIAAILKRPPAELFEKNHLDPKDQDDVLLATIIEFNLALQADDSSIIITNDTGPRLKSQSLQVTALSLPDEYMAAPEPDETERELLTVKKELDQHKNKLPQVSLCFANGMNYLEVEKPFEVISVEDFVQQKMVKLKKDVPRLVFGEDGSIILPNMDRMKLPMFTLRESQINGYNHELEQYFERYQQYLAEEYMAMFYMHNCCKISFLVKNSGSVPAQDLDIYIHFPDGFDVIEEEDLPKKSKKPSPPYKPQHSLDMGMGISIPTIANMSSFLRDTIPTPDLSAMNANVGGFDIKKTNSYDVNIHVRSIKHNQNVALDDLWLKFIDMCNAKGFAIDYKIMAANIPSVVKGKLNVSFIDSKK